MTTLHIRSMVRCYGLPKKAKDKIRKELTFKNPKYEEAKKKGRFISADMPAILYYYATDKAKEVFQVPRGYIWYLKKYLNDINCETKVKDETLRFPPLNLNFQGKLREYQEKGVDEAVRRYPVGVVEAATGAGKTVMAIAIIARRKQPTLIVVHNKELLYQWQGAIKKFLNYDCGLLGDGKFEIKDITVGIINTVRNKTDQIRTKFGHIIVDECHRCPSVTWTETLTQFPARYYLGLSATPFRRDGLGHAIYAFIGPKLHTVDKKMLMDTGAVLKPRIFRIDTRFRYLFKDDYSTMISSLTKNDARNELISDAINDDFRRFKQNILIVSDRVTHCKKIAEKLKYKYNLNSRILHGGVKKNDRKQIVADVKSGKCNILIATLSLIGEGFDAPNLSSLFLTTPVKFSGRVIQTVGRVLRPDKNKVPRVYDFRDTNVPVLKHSGFNRDRIYKKQWG